MEKAKNFFTEALPYILVGGFVLTCAIFMLLGTKSENGSITLDGNNAQIEESTKKWIESQQEALNRLMNQDGPTDEATIREWNSEAAGKGFYTTIDDVIGRILPDGSKPFQCSRYTAYLGTGQLVYSTTHIDYGPVNGKDVAQWLVDNYDYKYVDQPVKGAIGSGAFNTLYGHTALYLYSTGDNTAMVSDANYVPLAVSTHNMNIEGWLWVVPSSYNQQPEPDPIPSPTPLAPDTGIIRVK